MSDMARYDVIAYPDEEGNKRQSTIIKAENYENALKMAWRMFPEHHEIGVYEIDEELAESMKNRKIEGAKSKTVGKFVMKGGK